MAIKSVREISFFQTLRDRELKLSFYNEVPGRTNDEIAQFTYYLVLLAKNSIDQSNNSELIHMEKDCVASLFSKINPDLLKETGSANLTVIETIHLHNILDYFQNNFETFVKFTKRSLIPHHLTPFALAPEVYNNAIICIKNNLVHRLGESMANNYKYSV